MQGMVSKEKLHLNLAKLKKNGEEFEIDVDADLAMKYKNGENVSLKEILKSEHIFRDAKKGELASEHHLEAIFETSDPLKIAEIILKEGEVQLTSEYRQKMMDQKKAKIKTEILKNAIDPRTNAPIPEQRLENAFEEAKIKIDFNKSVEEQVNEIVHKLKPVMPIKIDKKIVNIQVDHNYANKVYGNLKKYGSVKANWGNDGSLTAEIEMPAGMFNDLLDELNGLTHGTVIIR